MLFPSFLSSAGLDDVLPSLSPLPLFHLLFLFSCPQVWTERPTALFRGMIPIMLRAFPANAVSHFYCRFNLCLNVVYFHPVVGLHRNYIA